MNKEKPSPFLIIIIFVIALGSLLTQFDYQNTRGIKYVTLGETKVEVELAIEVEEQIQGLSGRAELYPDSGMLFIFQKLGEHLFWMKGMNFAIDIIWISEDKKIVFIKKNAEPEAFLETYGANTNAKYVLEVVSGFVDKHNIKVGDSVGFSD